MNRTPSAWATGHWFTASNWGLYGLKPGDTQRLKLDPEQAYGLRDPQQVHRLPRERFTGDIQPEPGLIIGFDNAGRGRNTGCGAVGFG